MKKLTITLTLGFLLLLLMSCGGIEVTPDVPPEIVYGEDICDQCNMIISDERFAAGLVVEVKPGTYEHRIFDDIGDLLAYEQKHGAELTIAAYYVHDYHSKEWIDGRNAYYIQSYELLTPMGFGLAATAQKLEADALAREWNGTVLTFTELQGQSGIVRKSEHHAHQHTQR